jgi:hypothetical protein
MKNLDRIYGLSKSQVLLEELSSRLNIDYFIRSQSNQLLTSFKEVKRNWDENDSDYIVRISIFISSRLRTAESSSVVSLSALLKELPCLHDFMVKLKEFISLIALDSRVKSDMQSILASYAFSLTLFSKFEEIWKVAAVFNDKLKKVAWTIFVLSRVNLIQRRVEVVECACMLVACVHVVIMHSECELNNNENDCLNSLASVIKGQAEQIRISANHLKKMLELFVKHKVVNSASGIKGIFSDAEIQSNYEKLSFEYIHKLLPSEFDQRVLVDKDLIEFKDIGVASKFVVKAVLAYEVPKVNVFHELMEVKLKMLPFNNPGQDLSTWLQSAIPNENSSYLELIKSHLSKIWFFSSNDDYSILLKIFTKVYESSFEGSNLNLSLAVALLVHSSVYNLKGINAEKVLSLENFSPFNLYSEVNKLIQSDPPDRVVHKLKKVRLVLLTSLVWTDEKFLNEFKIFTGSKKESHSELKDFFSDLLFYCNFFIREISRHLLISEKLQEEIWQILKSCLTQECEILFNRNIHQIVLCCIYGLSKAKNLNVTFNSIVSRMLELDQRAEELFRKIQIEDSTGDIIKYYNEEFLKYMKTYLLSVSRTPSEMYSTPLNISNGATSSLTLVSPTLTPIYTPGSRKAYEFGQSPIEHLVHFNRMLTKNTQVRLDFYGEKSGTPSKKPKFAEEIYKDDEIADLPGEIPGLRDDSL